MSEEAPEENTPAPEDDDFEEVSFVIAEKVRDQMLVSVARVIESGALGGLGITVNVSGQVLTGTLVPRDEWFAGLLSIAEGGAKVLVEKLQAAWEEVPADEDPYYLHLEAAHLVGDTIPGGPGARWRVQIEEVGAWTLGEISSS